MRKLAAFGLLTLAALTLSGCFGPSTYHPYDGNDGYSDTQLNNTLYEVKFYGNDMTSKDATYNMMLYRAAQIALSSGYDYFRVINRRFATQTETFTNPGEQDTYITKHKHHKVKTTTYTPPSTETVTRYTAIMRIRLLRHNVASNRVYNARTLRNSLRSQINWPKKN